MTTPVQMVLAALLAAPTRERYGLELCEMTGLPSGTMYPIVARLEQAGLLDSRWEDTEQHASEGRPRRRYYKLTTDGAEWARATINARARLGRLAGVRPQINAASLA
jgi:DNA-binding PadR family transcriptional regulator